MAITSASINAANAKIYDIQYDILCYPYEVLYLFMYSVDHSVFPKTNIDKLWIPVVFKIIIIFLIETQQSKTDFKSNLWWNILLQTIEK